MGKAALPKEAAQWLSDQLLERFNIMSTVEENTRSGYTGYGITIQGITDIASAKAELKKRRQE